MTIHKQTLVNTRCYVDVDIAPLVEWLVSFKSIATLFSCQGNLDQSPDWTTGQEFGEALQGPYVLFTCKEADLKKILKHAREFLLHASLPVTVAVDHYDEELPFRYTMSFRSKLDMSLFLSFLNGEDIGHTLLKMKNKELGLIGMEKS